MKRWRLTLVAVVCGLLVASIPALADFSGSLTSADGGLEGKHQWVEDPHSTISWSVTWSEPDNAWFYDYTFNVPEFAISHMIIEVSDDFTLADIWSVEGEHTEILLDEFDQTKGNPSMPGSVFGIKLDGYIQDPDPAIDAGYTTANLSFLSRRNPVWANFYAKCGGRRGDINEAWNAGFDLPNPLDGPADGSINNHILAPNGYVPEPATTALFAIGIAGLAARRFRRRNED